MNSVPQFPPVADTWFTHEDSMFAIVLTVAAGEVTVMVTPDTPVPEPAIVVDALARPLAALTRFGIVWKAFDIA